MRSWIDPTLVCALLVGVGLLTYGLTKRGDPHPEPVGFRMAYFLSSSADEDACIAAYNVLASPPAVGARQQVVKANERRLENCRKALPRLDESAWRATRRAERLSAMEVCATVVRAKLQKGRLTPEQCIRRFPSLKLPGVADERALAGLARAEQAVEVQRRLRLSAAVAGIAQGLGGTLMLVCAAALLWRRRLRKTP